MFDWRGTPIKEGRRVITHGLGKFPQRTVGTVQKLNKSTVTVKVLQRSSRWHEGAYTIVGPDSLTVLTPDLFEEAS
jgi:hypothetical protein